MKMERTLYCPNTSNCLIFRAYQNRETGVTSNIIEERGPDEHWQERHYRCKAMRSLTSERQKLSKSEKASFPGLRKMLDDQHLDCAFIVLLESSRNFPR